MGGGRSMRGLDRGGGVGGINVVNSTDVWTYRHGKGNAAISDAINSGMRALDNDFPGFTSGVNSVDVAEIKGYGKNSVIGFWSAQDRQLALNQNYADIAKTNTVMDRAAQSGFHPSRGNRSGVEAVAIHEAGHALTDTIAQRTGQPGLHAVSENVVKNAYKNSGAKGGVRKFAGTISGYAQHNYAECVAEAVADWYCNGNKASSASKAIMTELKRIY